MNLNDLLDRLESGEAVSKTLRGLGKVEGLGEAFFLRIVSYHGVSPERVQLLGRCWRALRNRVGDPAFVCRAGGVYERSRARWELSARAFVAAGECAVDPVSQASFCVGAIDSCARAGNLDEAERLAISVSAKLKELGQPGLAARALLNLGNALVYQDRMEEARGVLGQALPALESAGFVQEAASAKLALSSTHLFGGDPRKAIQLATEVEDSAVASEFDYLADLARLNRALGLIVTNCPEDAHGLLLGLRESLLGSTFDEARVAEYLADSLSRMNLWGEAEETYRQVIAQFGSLAHLHLANIHFGLGQVLLLQGNLDSARMHLRAALRGYRRVQNRPWEAACLNEIAKLEAQGGRRTKARAHLLQAEARAAGSPYHLAQILLTASWLGENRVEEAASLIRKNGYSGLDWEVHALRAATARQPGTHYRRMFRAILAGRLAARSVVARLGFLKDKSAALQGYLGWLLAKPTRKRILEATDVILQLRSATLLEEILSLGSLPKEASARLEKLRGELEGSLDETPTGSSRAGLQASVSLSQVQRATTEALLELNLAGFPRGENSGETIILAETGIGLRILNRSTVSKPSLSDAKIHHVFRRLSYELLEPMTRPGAKCDSAEGVLRQLAMAFPDVWQSGSRFICPDGIGWRVPWSLCAIEAGYPQEWAVAMHPGMTNEFGGSLHSGLRCAVWLGSTKNLPSAKAEAEAIASRFSGCRIITSREEARNSLQESFDVLHLVSHAVHRPQNPMLSAVLFPDGPLYAYEVSRSRLSVRLATLSACDTGSVSLSNRTEPDGLARAFLSRGAESVVASQWPLDDEAAFWQADALYGSLNSGKTIRDSIFHARCISRERWPHPYYWGALALYSGYKR